MIRVVATGTFDILHPGHLYYLEESRELGDELYVIVARDANVRHKPRPILPEEQRLRMVRALKPVDHAILGDLHDMFKPIEEIRPDIITLGFNQHFDEKEPGRNSGPVGLTRTSSGYPGIPVRLPAHRRSSSISSIPVGSPVPPTLPAVGSDHGPGRRSCSRLAVSRMTVG